MSDSIGHRGPDDFGYLHVDPSTGVTTPYSEDFPEHAQLQGLVFAFRRLSILDLSPAGHQPMVSDDQFTVVSFNGEIYNFIELRAELEALGTRFRSNTDTEVLLKAYERWGEACFEKFNGMWAVTLWDGHRNRLVVSRDRFGVKPLYYASVDGTWIFASEIKALLRHPGVGQQVNERALYEFLRWGRIDHSTCTTFADVRAVPPGSIMQVSTAGVTERKFWQLDLAGGNDPKLSESEWIDSFRELFTDSVRLRMRSDVPIGTMMSGGLDSTSIAGVIRARLRHTPSDTAGSAGLASFHHAFSACWPGWSADEEAEIDTVCAAFGLEVHKLHLNGEDLARSLRDVVIALDEPFMTPICLVNFRLMRLAQQHGIKVVLNGHGSDESLAGYANTFAKPLLMDLFMSGRLMRFAREHRAFSDRGEYSAVTIARLFLEHVLPVGLVRRLRSIRQALRPGFERIFDPAMRSAYPYLETDDLSTSSPSGEVLRRTLAEKVLVHHLPQWLRMEDRMSMASSIESRLPFMDYRLVQLAFDMPAEMKLRDGWTKYVLRRAMDGILPDSIVQQKQKRHFSAPDVDWFRTSWRPFISQLLLEGVPSIAAHLDIKEFRRRLVAWLDGDDSSLQGGALWRTLNAEIWMDAVVRRNTGRRIGTPRAAV